MRLVCSTCDAVQAGTSLHAASERCGVAVDLSCASCGAALYVEAAEGEVGWFVAAAGGHGGPYEAARVARLLEQGAIDWNTPVWRPGLKSWRPARRDDLLVEAVAGVHGNANETRRLERISPEVLDALHAEDTVVQRFPMGSGATALPRSDTDSDAVALALADVRAQRPSREVSQSGLSQRSHAELRTSMAPHSTQQRAPRRRLVLLLVAAVSFVAGVLLACYRAELFGAEPVPPAVSAAGAAQAPSAPEPSVEQEDPGTMVTRAPGALRSDVRMRPTPEEVDGELTRIGPLLRRCMARRSSGLDIELFVEGLSGFVSDFEVRGSELSESQSTCVRSALDTVRLAPFAISELAFRQSYAW